MAKYGNYGWSPRQMERINERRAKRGQEELRNLRYEYRPMEDRKSSVVRPKQSPIGGEMDGMSLKDRQASRTAEFRKGFEKPTVSLSQKDSIESKRAIADEEFKRKFRKKQKGISTPTTQDAMNRVMGLA